MFMMEWCVPVVNVGDTAECFSFDLGGEERAVSKRVSDGIDGFIVRDVGEVIVFDSDVGQSSEEMWG